MTFLGPDHFAATMGIGVRAAQTAFKMAAEGKPWKGIDLPVIALAGQSVGRGGKVWALALDRCSAELKAKLGIVEGPFEAPAQRAFKGEVAAWQWEEQADRLRIIAPILGLPKRAAERAAAFRDVAAQLHVFRGVPTRIAENTLRDWVRVHETQGPARLVTVARSDKGAARVLFTREWDGGIDLPPDRRAAIAARVTRDARSMVYNDGTSVTEAVRLAGDISAYDRDILPDRLGEIGKDPRRRG